MLIRQKQVNIKDVSLFIIICILSLPACDVLTKSPKDNFNPDNFYTNEKSANAAVLGTYARLYDEDGGRWPVSLYGLVSDNQYEPSYVPFQRKHALDTYTYRAENADLRRLWQGWYKVVDRANVAINKIPDIDMDPSKKKQLIGEARFLRGFTYFWLEQNFGDVPLVLGSKNSLEGDGGQGNTPMKEIDVQIISDLQAAEQNLPEKYTGEEVGRATSGAATSMLARVYLALASYEANNIYPNRNYAKSAEAYYKEAGVEAKKVIDSGIYSLFENYKDNFSLETENGKEHIFSFQYSRQTNQNLYNFFGLPFQCGLTPASAEGEFIPTLDIFKAYKDDDYRRKVNFITECTTPDGQHLTYKDFSAPVPHMFTWYPLSGKSGPVGDPIALRSINVPVMRYAEILLIYAETLNELGETDMAYKYVNMIKKRARHGNPDASPQDIPAGSLSQNEFRKMIYKVRRLEFPFEGLRKYDLDRSGLLKQELCKPNAPFVMGCKNVTNDYVLFPIPSRELQLNPSLKQNPGF